MKCRDWNLQLLNDSQSRYQLPSKHFFWLISIDIRQTLLKMSSLMSGKTFGIDLLSRPRQKSANKQPVSYLNKFSSASKRTFLVLSKIVSFVDMEVWIRRNVVCCKWKPWKARDYSWWWGLTCSWWSNPGMPNCLWTCRRITYTVINSCYVEPFGKKSIWEYEKYYPMWIWKCYQESGVYLWPNKATRNSHINFFLKTQH